MHTTNDAFMILHVGSCIIENSEVQRWGTLSSSTMLMKSQWVNSEVIVGGEVCVWYNQATY